MQFEWDDKKAKINMEKHGVSFAEASTVFEDAQGILFDDPDHSQKATVSESKQYREINEGW